MLNIGFWPSTEFWPDMLSLLWESDSIYYSLNTRLNFLIFSYFIFSQFFILANTSANLINTKYLPLNFIRFVK